MTEPTIFNKMAHPEPSLSSDVKSMLHDEINEHLRDIDLEIINLRERVPDLEKKTNGLIQMRADHGHQFIVIIDRVKALEERVTEWSNEHTDLRQRVAALEQQQDTLHKWVVDTYAEHELEPLPKEELE